MWMSRRKLAMPAPDQALAGRAARMPVAEAHFVNGHRLTPPFPAGLETAIFGLGCFWGAERCFWQLPGVYSTAVGYAGGHTPNPTYEEDAPAAPAIPKPCWSCSTPSSSATRRC